MGQQTKVELFSSSSVGWSSSSSGVGLFCNSAPTFLCQAIRCMVRSMLMLYVARYGTMSRSCLCHFVQFYIFIVLLRQLYVAMLWDIPDHSKLCGA